MLHFYLFDLRFILLRGEYSLALFFLFLLVVPSSVLSSNLKIQRFGTAVTTSNYFTISLVACFENASEKETQDSPSLSALLSFDRPIGESVTNNIPLNLYSTRRKGFQL